VTAVDTPQGGQLLGDLADDPIPRQEPMSDGPSTQAAPAPAASGRKAVSKAVFIALPAAFGALALWFLLYSLVLSGMQEHGSQTRLYDQYRLQLAAETAPLAEPIKVGSPVAMMSAPSAGIRNLVVVEGSTSRLLTKGPGHLSNTPLPGQIGTSIILGRSVTYGAPFRDITKMKVGDQLTVTTGEGVFRFRVEDVRLPGESLPPLLKTNQSRLTLVTSASGGWRSGWAPTHTVYVDALLAHGRAQAVPAGLTSTVSAASRPMQGDASGLVPFIFWLEALLIVSVAVGWSWLRWGRMQTWIVGAPIFLFALWGTTNELMRFVPNLL
jgi:sortase A